MLAPSLFILIVLALLALFFWSLRGRRVDDHPVCRRCKFDLSGNPQAATCPECGRDLSDPRAIQTGNRIRHTFIATFALVLILLGLLCGSTLTFSKGAQKYLPVPVLRWEASFPSTSNSDAALAELIDRLKTGKLSKAQIASVANDALAAQADTSRKWDMRWGDFVELAHGSGTLPTKDWKQYTACAMTHAYELQVRAKVRQGAPLPFVVNELTDNARVGTQSMVDYHFDRIEIDGKSRKVTGGHLPVASGYSGIGFQRSVPRVGGRNAGETSSLAPGQHRMAIDLHVGVVSSRTKLLADMHVPVRHIFQIVPARVATVRGVHQADKAQTVRQSIHLGSLEISSGKGVYFSDVLHVNNLPIALACQVILKLPGGRQWELNPILIESHQWPVHQIWQSWDDLQGFNGRYVDIILKPDPKIAERSVTLTHYWGKPIVFKHVKVDWSGVPKKDRPTF